MLTTIDQFAGQDIWVYAELDYEDAYIRVEKVFEDGTVWYNAWLPSDSLGKYDIDEILYGELTGDVDSIEIHPLDTLTTDELIAKIKADGGVTASKQFTKYPQGYVKADKILAYVTDEEDRAWGLLDAWFEREWGEIPYNESARQILIDEFPWDYNVSDDGSDWEEGTGAVVLDLKDHEVSYRVFEDDMREKVVKYSSLDELIKDFIQPLHDGTITSENLRERCEDYLS